MALRIRKGDFVQVIAGADRGKQGRVLAIDRERGRARVEKVRMTKRHVKGGRRNVRAGGIIEQEGYLDLSKLMLVDASTSEPSRVRIEVQEGRRVRVFKKSGNPVPEPV